MQPTLSQHLNMFVANISFATFGVKRVTDEQSAASSQ